MDHRFPTLNIKALNPTIYWSDKSVQIKREIVIQFCHNLFWISPNFHPCYTQVTIDIDLLMLQNFNKSGKVKKALLNFSPCHTLCIVTLVQLCSKVFTQTPNEEYEDFQAWFWMWLEQGGFYHMLEHKKIKTYFFVLIRKALGRNCKRVLQDELIHQESFRLAT